jgi:hypothetical protein
MGTGELRSPRLVKPAPGYKATATQVLAQDTKRRNIGIGGGVLGNTSVFVADET